MKRFLEHISRRHTHDGWTVRCVLEDGTRLSPVWWLVSTTRAEARQVQAELDKDLFERTEVCKVRIKVEAVD